MIENFSEKLKKYAELIVKVGVNVQKGQPVVLIVIIGSTEKLRRSLIEKNDRIRRKQATFACTAAICGGADHRKKIVIQSVRPGYFIWSMPPTSI